MGMSPDSIGGHKPRCVLARFPKPDGTDERVSLIRRAYAPSITCPCPYGDVSTRVTSCSTACSSQCPGCPFPFCYRQAESLEKCGFVPSVAMSIGEQVIDDLFSSYHHLLIIGQLHGLSLPKYTTKERRAKSPWTTTLPAAIIGGDIKPCLKKVPDDDKTLPPAPHPYAAGITSSRTTSASSSGSATRSATGFVNLLPISMISWHMGA
jgi:hypothetical protein